MMKIIFVKLKMIFSQCYQKYVSRLLGITASGEHCILATKSDESTAQNGKYGLILCNTIGTPVDSKFCCKRAFHFTNNNNNFD